VLGNEHVALIALGGAFGKARSDDLYERLQVEKSSHGQTSVAGICRSVAVADRAGNFNM
jgi:hypothetical protein